MKLIATLIGSFVLIGLVMLGLSEVWHATRRTNDGPKNTTPDPIPSPPTPHA